MTFTSKKPLVFSNAVSLRLATEGRRAFMNFLQTNNENQRIIAEGKYLECIKRFPEDTAAKLFLATMKLVKLSDGTDRTDEAIALLKTFDKTDRWHFDATFNLASAYIVKGDEVEATRLLTRLSQERGRQAG